jgi:regulator of replication initiation timing
MVLKVMTDKEVQHLSEVQLIEILYMLSQENDSLREENAQLKARLDAIVDKMVEERSSAPVETSTAASPSSKSKKKRK